MATSRDYDNQFYQELSMQGTRLLLLKLAEGKQFDDALVNEIVGETFPIAYRNLNQLHSWASEQSEYKEVEFQLKKKEITHHIFSIHLKKDLESVVEMIQSIKENEHGNAAIKR